VNFNQKKYLSLKNQLIACFGFMVLFLGLFVHFFSKNYHQLWLSQSLIVLVSCTGAAIVVLSLLFAFIPNRNHLDELWRQLVIESSLMFAFNFSFQALLFHYFFYNILAPVSLGVFFIFLSYFILFLPLPISFTLSLFRKYYVIYFIAIVFVSVGTLASGIFLTFTGSIDPIIDEGIGVLSLGAISLLFIVSFIIFFPIWKSLLSEDEINEKEEGIEEEEGMEEQVEKEEIKEEEESLENQFERNTLKKDG
jgi:hypothetical protein